MKKLISVVLALAMILSLSAGVFAYNAPANINSLAIVGDNIPGVGSWNPADPAGDMELVADYVYVKEVTLSAGTSMNFKIAGNDNWDDACNFGTEVKQTLTLGTVTNMVCHGGSSDMTVSADKDMTVKITADLTDFVNGGNATVLVEEVVEDNGYLLADVSKEFASAGWAPSDGVVFVPSADGTLTVNVTAFSSIEAPEGFVTDLYNNDTMDWGGEYYSAETGEVQYAISAGYTYILYVYPAAVNGGFMNWATGGSVSYTATADVKCEITEIKEPEPGEDENNPIIFDTTTYTATVPANSTVWYAFDDFVGMYENGIYQRSYAITGNTGFGVTNAMDSFVDTDGSVSCTAYGNYMGLYVFSITNLTDSEQSYAVTVSNADSGEGGGEGGGEDEDDNIVYGDGNISITDAPCTDVKPWTYIFTTESTGILHIVIGDCNPGWRYKIITPDGVESLYKTKFNTGVDAEHPLTQIGTYELRFYAYSSAEASNVDGTISADITFTADDIEVEIPKEDYIVSDTEVFVGDNFVTMEENAITSIFAFAPTENGIYTITVSDPAALVGYWGAYSHFVMDYTENKTNVLVYTMDAGEWKLIEPLDENGDVILEECYEEWSCPNIMIGVSGIEGDFVLTIEKTGDAEKEEETVYDSYVNVHIPSDENLVDTTGEQVNHVDITKPQTVVKDENGFYHLGSVDGPMVYVNLISDGFDITAPYYSGMGAITLRGQYIDDEGNVYNYDFLTAMRAYANVAYMCEYEDVLYPLTDDLMIFMKGYGAYQGWFEANTSSFEAIDGTQNADSAWLVACVYLGEEIVDETPDEPEVNPGSGDYSVAGLVVAMMAATAGAIVISKKKEF